MKIRLASDLQPDSIVDGEGMRTVIWFQGCLHNCPGCHNPNTHDLNGGIELDIEDVKKQMDNLEFQNGITLSGGDPFFQPEAATALAKYAHEIGLNVWAYTGFIYENIINNPKYQELLNNIDVLVDGPFILKEKSLDCKFRGSKNQRIIDVKKSIESGKVIDYYEV